MNDEDPDQHQHTTSLAVDVNKQYLDLYPYAELGQHIMDSAICEINIIDTYYQGTVAHNVDEAVYKDIICYDTIRQNGRIYEIEDLTKNKRYKDHSYVKHPPYFQYYCSAKLTNKSGRTVGSIYVLDTKSKCVTGKQREQLRQLAHIVMNTIEYESKYRELKNNLGALSDDIHKINHDVRTPISGIVGISDLLLEEKEHIDFPSQGIRMIKEAAETILHIIDGILESLNTDSYEYEEQNKKRFSSIVKQLKRLFKPPSKAKELSLTFVNQIDTSLRVSHSFSLKLLQIISNLLSNAIKFTPQNGSIEITLNQETVKNSNLLRITVMDNGQGMTADQVTAFNKSAPVARSANTNPEQSFGRGLAYVKQMVAQTGGTISVKTTTNNGTKFLCSLPIPVDNFSVLLSSLRESQN